MSQRQMLQDMDAILHGAFASAGMADTGVYISAGTTDEIPCSCYFDNANLQELGEAGLVNNPRKELTILNIGGGPVRPALLYPKSGDHVTLDGKTYILKTKQDSDESSSRWTVNYV